MRPTRPAALARSNLAFTTLEVLCVAAVFALVAAIGYPMLQSYRLSTALSSAAEDTGAFLLRARWMAINAGASRTVDLSSPTTLSVRNAGGTTLASVALGGYSVTQTSSQSSLVLDGRGFVSPPATITITLTNPLSATRTLIVTPLGKVMKP